MLAALGGALADVWGWWRPLAGAKKKGAPPWAALATALVPLALGIWLGRLVPAPETVAGPRVLLVQPSFEQERKQQKTGARDMMLEQIELTRQGMEEAARAGEPTPD